MTSPFNPTAAVLKPVEYTITWLKENPTTDYNIDQVEKALQVLTGCSDDEYLSYLYKGINIQNVDAMEKVSVLMRRSVALLEAFNRQTYSPIPANVRSVAHETFMRYARYAETFTKAAAILDPELKKPLLKTVKTAEQVAKQLKAIKS